MLSAVEGLDLVSPASSKLILPISGVIIVALFAVQARGTALLARQTSTTELRWLVEKLEAMPVHRVSGTAVDATSYFDIPTNRVVEVGTQVGI